MDCAKELKEETVFIIKKIKGWGWVSLLCSGDSSRSSYLCNLAKSKYGMESESTWCIVTMSDQEKLEENTDK